MIEKRRVTGSSAILEGLALQHRRVLSDWRALQLLRQATFRLPPNGRRWSKLPHDVSDLASLLRQMRDNGDIQSIKGYRRLYEVIVPYARLGFVDEREILFELNPYAVLSHFSALVFHGLTEQFPKRISATISTDKTGGLLPLGTESMDWEGVALPGARTPEKVLRTPMDWIRTKPERFFGFSDFRPDGFPIRVTTMERTLIDALQSPEICGGIDNVLAAWASAAATIDVDMAVGMVQRFDVALLRQRVGFILEELGFNHPQFELWRRQSHRGGSSKLLGSAPFASAFSQRWNLSLNTQVDVLHGDFG